MFIQDSVSSARTGRISYRFILHYIWCRFWSRFLSSCTETSAAPSWPGAPECATQTCVAHPERSSPAEPQPAEFKNPLQMSCACLPRWERLGSIVHTGRGQTKPPARLLLLTVSLSSSQNSESKESLVVSRLKTVQTSLWPKKCLVWIIHLF